MKLKSSLGPVAIAVCADKIGHEVVAAAVP